MWDRSRLVVNGPEGPAPLAVLAEFQQEAAPILHQKPPMVTAQPPVGRAVGAVHLGPHLNCDAAPRPAHGVGSATLHLDLNRLTDKSTHASPSGTRA